MPNPLFFACRGPEADVTDLQWASAFLSEIDGDNGVLGEAMKKSDDPTALYHAWNALCRMVRNLHAAYPGAESDEAAIQEHRDRGAFEEDPTPFIPDAYQNTPLARAAVEAEVGR